MVDVNAVHARRPTAWLLAGLMGLAGCVDVPVPAQPVDAAAPVADRGPDGGPDATPVDRGPAPDALADRGSSADATPDGGPDAAPDVGLDAAPDAGPDASVDVAVDAGPDPFDDCLIPVSGVRDPDGPCLRVRPVPGPERPFVFAASATIAPGTADQRVVVTGGLEPAQPGQGLRSARIYDPQADAWLEDGPTLSTGRWGHGMLRLGDGDLLVAGGASQVGEDGFWEGLATLNRWTPGDAAWARPNGGLTPGRSDGALVVVGELAAIYLGGTADRDSPALREVDLLPTLGAIGPTTVLQQRRAGPMAVALPDDSVLVVGGLGIGGEAVASAERLGVGAVRLLSMPEPPLARAFGGTAGLPDGALFVGGVALHDGPPTTAAFRYQSRYNRFVNLEPLVVPRIRPSVTAIGPVGHGWRLVVGGEAADGQPGLVELYDPRSDRFTAYTLPAPVARRRARHTAAAFDGPDGREVLVAGGYDPAGDPADPAAYHGQALRFELQLPPAIPRPLGIDCLPTVAEQADAPCLRVWRGPPLSTPRTELAIAGGRDGPVVVTGGLDPQSDVLWRTVESWLPGTGAWSGDAGLQVARAGHRMVALSNESRPPMAVLGGVGFWEDDAFQALVSNEIRQPDAGQWVMAPLFADARANAALVQHDDGLLIIGGQAAAPGDVLATTERFGVGAVEPRADLVLGRTRHVACTINLDAGPQVVVYGGYTRQGPTGAIETYVDEESGWVSAPGQGPPMGDATCIGGRTAMDVFGGLDEHGEPSALWQRIDGVTGEVVEVDRLHRPRVRPTVAAIGLVGSEDPAHLVVGGQVDGDGPAIVELVLRERDQRFAYALPPEIGRRIGHAATSYTWLAGVTEVREGEVQPLHWRDVVVAGGQDPVSGLPLDEVLVFGVSSSGGRELNLQPPGVGAVD